ncbi:MAG: ROK family protein [Planctomycetes bacterium]|nr:ROK family protein [Planctomycetota bacterium]
MGNNDGNRAARWVGFDLGGTKMLAVVLDDQFTVLGRKRRRTRSEGSSDAAVGVDRILETVQQALDDAQVDARQLSGIGVGCPGPVDLDRGIVLEAANLGWKNVRLREALEQRFSCPAAVLNDVDAGVYGENQLGAAKQARTVLGVFPGTGIGGGCVYEGQILRGKNTSCMEIGHIEITHNGNLCGCGRRGCLETEASRLAISAEVAKAAYRGETPHLTALAGTDLSDIRSGVLASAISAGDVVVEQIVKRAAQQIGTAVANVVNLLCPDTVVLGGGLVEAMPELFVKTVSKTARARVMPCYADAFQVVASALGDLATVKGAAAWVRRTVGGPRLGDADKLAPVASGK